MDALTGDNADVGKVVPTKWLYWLICGTTVLLYLIGIRTGLALFKTPLWSVTGEFWTIGPGILLAIALHIAFSWRQVKTNEVAGSFFYGKALRDAKAGPHFIPFRLMQLRAESGSFQEFQFPDDPEKVFKGDDKDPLPEKMQRPIRMVTRAADPNKPDEKEILDVQMTLVINFVVQFKVTSIFSFAANVGTLTEAHRQLRDIGEITIAEHVTKKTAAGVIRDLPAINQALEAAVQQRVQNWGVEIISARMISPDITHTVSSALAAIPETSAKAVQTRTIADAAAYQTRVSADASAHKIRVEGVATATATEANLVAKAKGLEEQKKRLGIMSGDTVLAAETATNAFANADTLVVGAEGGMRDLLGAVKGAESALKGKIIQGGGS